MMGRYVQGACVAVAVLVLAACGQVAVPGDASIQVTPESPGTIGVGQTLQLTANVTVEAGVDDTVTWSSDNESAATVDNTGLVSGVGAGSANITATLAADTSVSDSVTVTVVEPAVNSVTIPEGDQTLYEGETFDFSANVDVTGGADASVTWSSDNESAATVDANGVVTAVAAGVGTATITATSDFDAGQSDSVIVTVLDVVYVDESASAGGDGSQASPFQTIPEGVTAVEVGGKVVVAAGTYSDAVTVNKSVTFVGANENQFGTRGAESTITGDILIDGPSITVVMNGFQFQSSGNPGITTQGTNHSVDLSYNVFDGAFRKIRVGPSASYPLSFTFAFNAVNVTNSSSGGFLQISGDPAGGSNVAINNNTMSFVFASTASPAINVSSGEGVISNNSIDMDQIVGGQDNTRIGLLIADNSELSVSANTFTNTNQAIRFFQIGSALGPVTIDSNSITNVRQGIVVDATGTISSISVTNNTIGSVEEGIRLANSNVSISANAFNGASFAYVIDENVGYDLNAILGDNTFSPAATVGTTPDVNAYPAIVEQ